MISNNEFNAIAALDLDPIKVKLMHKESGEGWTLEYANAVEFEYRRFLYLMKKFPNEQTAPAFDVDIFWHYHILDTMKYAVDCDAVFGYFLHHFPYIGLRGEDDEAAHVRVGARMQELYEETFGEPSRLGAQATAGSAWSSVVTGAQASQAAWSSTVTQDARRAHATQAAWSSTIAGMPHPGAGRTAWSSVVAGDAGRAHPARAAWSSVVTGTPAGQSAWSSSVTGAVLSSPAEAIIPAFYSVRPTLAAA